MFASYLEERNIADEVDAVLVFLDVGVAERAMPMDQGRLADGTCAFLALFGKEGPGGEEGEEIPDLQEGERPLVPSVSNGQGREEEGEAYFQGIACLFLAIGDDDLKALALLKAIFPLSIRSDEDAVLFLGGESRLEELGQGEEEFLSQVPSFRLSRLEEVQARPVVFLLQKEIGRLHALEDLTADVLGEGDPS